MKRKTLSALLLASVVWSAAAQNEIPKTADIVKVCNKVAQYQIDNPPVRKKHSYDERDWTCGAWYRGAADYARVTNNKKIWKYLETIAERNDYRPWTRIYHADDVCVSQMYFELYKRTGDRKMIAPTLVAIDQVSKYPSKAPLRKNDPIGKDQRWSWSDALFMAPPVYAVAYNLLKEPRYEKYLDNEFKLCTDSLYDRTEHLYYRDNMRIALREKNGAKQFWARGNGWVYAGIPLVLDNLPKDYAKRGYYEEIFKEMSAALLKCQNEKGYWHASLLDAASYPMPENSASAFFCYGLLWGVRNGLLPADVYLPAALKAWHSLNQYVNEKGKVGYIQPIGADPRSVDAESTENYGVGGFLMAGAEMYLLSKKK